MLSVSKVFIIYIVTFLSFSPALYSKNEAEDNQKPMFIYNSHNKRDPFYPTADQKKKEEVVMSSKDFRIEGIIYDATSPMVIINGKVLQVGEFTKSKKGAKVKITKIEENAISLKDEKNNEIIIKIEPKKTI